MPFWSEKSDKEKEKEKYLSEARKCKRRGEWDRAADFFYMAGAVEEALEMYVQSGNHQLAAQMLEKKGDLKRAAEHYILARDNRAAAVLLQKVGDAKRAASLYEKTGEHFKAAQLEESARSYRRAAELYLKSGHLDRAAANYAREGDHLRAAETLEDALTRGAPPDKETLEKQWAHAADLYTKAGRHRRAAEIWARFGHAGRAAESYQKAGEFGAAVEMFLRAQNPERASEAASWAPDGSVARPILAELRYARGEWREAAEIYRDLREPARAAECYDKAGEPLRAAEQYELAGELEIAADLLYANGAHAQASRLYERGLRYLMAARAAAEAGDHERAGALFGQAHEPVEAAKCWRTLGQADKAIAVLQQIQPHQDSHAEASILLGDLFREKGLHSIAAEKYRVAIEGKGVDETTIDAYYGLAVLHQEQGEEGKAIEILERIVATSYSYRDAAARLEAVRKARESAPRATTPAGGIPAPSAAAGDTLAMDAGPVAPAAGGSATGSTTGPLGRRYEIIARIGASSRGDVFKAWDASLGRTVVLKKLVSPEQTEEGQVRRLLAEAREASKLHHSNIATIYDALEGTDGRYIATEYVFGESLRSVLDREGKLSPARAVEILSQALLALDYAAEIGVMHRNLRPDNVLIAEKTHVKLTDFGMNRRLSDLLQEPETATGPLAYVSPEQVRGEKVDVRADLYALGCIAYEMLVGQPPFRPPDLMRQHAEDAPIPPSAVDANVPSAVEKVVLRCLEKDPERRYTTPRLAYEELRSFDFIPGMRIGERYELQREIGTGGMGKVFQARDLELDETIAMKILRPEFGTDTMLEQRFIREIKLARKIVHPSVVKVYDFGKWRNVKYITMEYIDGFSLDEYVRRTQPVNYREVLRFIAQICEALEAAHRMGVVHRDIKPQNVLVHAPDHPDRRAKIVDFGIARLEELGDLTSSKLIVGSPKYMSPEQVSGKGIDHRTDLYSLGIVLYYCCTGTEPFTAEDTNSIIMKQLHETPVPPTQRNPDLPPWLEMIILKCMVKDPRGRYQRAAEIARDIAAHMR